MIRRTRLPGKSIAQTLETPGIYTLRKNGYFYLDSDKTIPLAGIVEAKFKKLVLIGGGGAGARSQYREGRFRGNNGGDSIILVNGVELYKATGGEGGYSQFWYYNFMSSGGGGSGGWLECAQFFCKGILSIMVGAGGVGDMLFTGPNSQAGGKGGTPNGNNGGNGAELDNSNFNYYPGSGGGLFGPGNNGALSASTGVVIQSGAKHPVYGGLGGEGNYSGANKNGFQYGAGAAGGGPQAPGRGGDGVVILEASYSFL